MAKKEPKEQLSRIERVHQQLAANEAGKRAATQELDAATSCWLADPKNPALIAERESLKAEEEFYAEKIKRDRQALADAARQDSAEARAAATAAIDAEFEELLKRHKQIAEVDQQIANAFDNLAPLLAERDRLANDNQAAGYTIVRACAARGDDIDHNFRHLIRILRNEDARAPIIDRLFASGLGRVGLHLSPFLEVQPVRSNLTLADVAAKCERNARIHLSKFIAARKARLAVSATPEDKALAAAPVGVE